MSLQQLMTHETIEARRAKLRNESTEKHLALKARRYAFFRMQNFLEGGTVPEAEHAATVKEVEAEIAPLGGVLEFAKKWDFDPLTGKIISRDRSVWKAHDEFMERAAPCLGSKEAEMMERNIAHEALMREKKTPATEH